MAKSDIDILTKRDVILESFTEGKAYAARVRDDDVEFAKLQNEVNRKLRNLQRSKLIKKRGSEARDTLRKRVPTTATTAKLNRKDLNSVTAGIMFINAKTSTPAGKKAADSARALAFKKTLERMLLAENFSGLDAGDKTRMIAILDSMSEEELINFADVYREDLIGIKDLDSNSKLTTIAVHATWRVKEMLEDVAARMGTTVNEIPNLSSQGLRQKMIDTVAGKTTTKKDTGEQKHSQAAKREFHNAMKEALDDKLVLAQSSAEDIFDAIKPYAKEQIDVKNAQRTVSKARKHILDSANPDYIAAKDTIDRAKARKEGKKANLREERMQVDPKYKEMVERNELRKKYREIWKENYAKREDRDPMFEAVDAWLGQHDATWVGKQLGYDKKKLLKEGKGKNKGKTKQRRKK